MHVLAGTVARTCGKRGSALQGRMQCTARADAVHCGSGCSALRPKWVKLAPKSPVLFGIGDKGGETRPIRVTVAPLIYLLNLFAVNSSSMMLNQSK